MSRTNLPWQRPVVAVKLTSFVRGKLNPGWH